MYSGMVKLSEWLVQCIHKWNMDGKYKNGTSKSPSLSHLVVGRGRSEHEMWLRWHWQEEETWRKHNLKNFHINDFANVKCLSCSNVHESTWVYGQWLHFACEYTWLTLCMMCVLVSRSKSENWIYRAQTIRFSILMAMVVVGLVVVVTCFGISLLPYIFLDIKNIFSIHVYRFFPSFIICIETRQKSDWPTNREQLKWAQNIFAYISHISTA